MKFIIASVLSFCLLAGCAKTATKGQDTESIAIPESNVPVTKTVSYLALGDSYTIGQSATQEESFPYQLKTGLRAQGIAVSNLQMIAQTGWTTGELKSAIAAKSLNSKFDFVTLLIGVNNQFRGDSKDTYRKEFIELLNTAINYAGGDKKKVFVLSIPDWGVTSFGGNGADPQVSKQIDEFNQINKEETLKLNVSYTDITPISRQALNNLSMIAIDGLHPSGKMYKLWVEELLGKVVAAL